MQIINQRITMQIVTLEWARHAHAAAGAALRLAQ